MARRNGGSRKRQATGAESRLIKLIDQADTIKRYDTLLRKISKGTLDVPAFLKEVSMDAALQVVHLMHSSTDEKVQLAAATDLLDRAGHGKTTKHQHGGIVTVDHQASKMELINLILSSARRAGIETKEEVGGQLEARPETIDVTPPAEKVAAVIDEALSEPTTPEVLRDLGTDPDGDDDE